MRGVAFLLCVLLAVSPASPDELAVPGVPAPIGVDAAVSFPPSSGGGGGFSLAYETTLSVAAGFANTVTFSAVPIGPASTDRIVEIAEATDFQGGSGITAPTIGGVTATLAKNDGASPVRSAIYYANVPTGTTATIVLNGNGYNGVVMSVWDMHGQSGGGSAGPTSTAYGVSGAADPPGASLAVTVAGGGRATVFGAGEQTTFTACAVTNATLGGFSGPVGSNNEIGCAATASASATVTLSAGSGGFAIGASVIAASWGP